MENLSPTQQKSNNYTTKDLAKKEEIVKKIKENLNYIYIALMLICNCIFALFTIEDGSIGLNYPTTALGWVLWAIQIVLMTMLGVLILNAFRRQGIQSGHKAIKDVYDAYIAAMQKMHKITPRSLKQYMRSEIKRDTFTKGTVYVIVSVFVGSVLIGANLNNLISLVINILLSVGFGLKEMIDAEEFVVTELIIWYQLKTAEVTDQKLEPAKEKDNGLSKQRAIRRPRPTKSGGVQQTKKRGARPKTVDLIKPSSTANRTSSSRLPS